MIYNVKVDVEEVKNRILECRVRNHIIHVDHPKSSEQMIRHQLLLKCWQFLWVAALHLQYNS